MALAFSIATECSIPLAAEVAIGANASNVRRRLAALDCLNTIGTAQQINVLILLKYLVQAALRVMVTLARFALPRHAAGIMSTSMCQGANASGVHLFSSVRHVRMATAVIRAMKPSSTSL